MNSAKLTLSIPEKILAGAKSYSKRTRQPLSRLVSRYFAVLAGKSDEASDEIAPTVRRVTGLVQSDKKDEDLLLEALVSKYR